MLWRLLLLLLLLGWKTMRGTKELLLLLGCERIWWGGNLLTLWLLLRCEIEARRWRVLWLLLLRKWDTLQRRKGLLLVVGWIRTRNKLRLMLRLRRTVVLLLLQMGVGLLLTLLLRRWVELLVMVLMFVTMLGLKRRLLLLLLMLRQWRWMGLLRRRVVVHGRSLEVRGVRREVGVGLMVWMRRRGWGVLPKTGSLAWVYWRCWWLLGAVRREGGLVWRLLVREWRLLGGCWEGEAVRVCVWVGLGSRVWRGR